MAFLTVNRVPKGSTGMTLLSSRNDDSTVTMPDIGFDFFYNVDNCRSLIYVNANGWVGFASKTENLKINRKDTSCNKLFYSKEIENGSPIFRIRWEGNSQYSAWDSNDILWELVLYDDSTMVLVVEATPNNGINSFDTKGGTGSADWQAGKSYVLYPTQPQGRAYTIQEGSYYKTITKYLINDGENGIKTWQSNSWIKIADGPVTEEIIRSNGVQTLQASRNGLILTNPTLLRWTNDLNTPNCKVKTKALPKPKVIMQVKDYSIPTGIKSVVLTANVSGTAVIKVICSSDGGVTWKALNNSNWVSVNALDISSVKSSGMLATVVNAITEAQWRIFVGIAQTIRFAYYMEQNTLTEICNVDHIKLSFK